MKNSNFLILLLLLSTALGAIPPINLFRPTDRFLIPEVCPGTCFQFFTAYEGAIKARAFQDDFKQCFQLKNERPIDMHHPVNVLQLYQDHQNFLAAFKGQDSCTELGQFSQLFNINDENGEQGVLVPTGNLKIPANIMFGAKWFYNHNVWFGLFMPVIQMKLEDVQWCQSVPCPENETGAQESIFDIAQNLGGLDLHGWKRTGIGDLVAQVGWMRNFPQRKPFVRNVRPQIRLGLDFPTSKRADEDILLGIPFGNDGAWGVQLGGGLDLDFCYQVRGGVDGEFLFLFGNTRCRRIKIDCNQTDLLLFNKATAYKDFAVTQQFNIYIEKFWSGLAFKLNYQYLKQNDDSLTVFSDRFDPFVINSAENLQDWTAHSLIFNVRYDCSSACPTWYCKPQLSGWFKFGFNGKRAILLNTLGIQCTFAF